jgi:hypothetical protein
MPSSDKLRRVALVIIDVSEESPPSPILFFHSMIHFPITANVVPSSPILVTIIMEEIHTPKRRFLQEPHGVTPQKTAFFIVAAMKTSNLTYTAFLLSYAL